jgi:peptide chain release factor 1
MAKEHAHESVNKAEGWTKADEALEEYAEIERKLADPAVHQDQRLASRLGKRYAELKQIVSVYTEYNTLKGDLETALELAKEDKSFADEAVTLKEKLAKKQDELHKVLIPRDPDDASNVIMEIKAGAGGEESALFAGDLLRMYQLFASHKGWSFTIQSMSDTGIGGVKDAQIAIRAKGALAPQDGVWANLKYEGGVHRVQRVPVTESQGRIHTSAAGVYVFPEVEEDDEEIVIPQNDIRVDVFRSSGPGGQSVNTTDSAVRITHLPTGIVVSMQNEKSQIQNREVAMRVLKARLKAKQKEEEMAKASNMRLEQVRTVDRSERIRTYNFPENRIADHRTGYKAYNLDQVMNGTLEPVIASAVKMDEENAMKAG